jgi:hypothetical protein
VHCLEFCELTDRIGDDPELVVAEPPVKEERKKDERKGNKKSVLSAAKSTAVGGS